MIVEQLKNILTLTVIVLIGVAVVKFYPPTPICPDDFKDPKKEIASFSKWTDEFYQNNPKATMKEMSDARVAFWRDNNCNEALKRYDAYIAGNIDGETKQLIEMVAKEELLKNQRAPICPDEYENQESYIEAVGQWAGDFYDKNPNTTKEEVLSARKDFLIRSGCKETL